MTAPVLLDDGRWREDFGNGAWLEWSGCECGAPTPCPVWLGAGVRGCQPFPCRCEDIDDDPPQWKIERARRTGETAVYRCDPYISKKGYNVGQWVNRCPCWGQLRDGKPEGCCVNHSGNPRYVEVGPDGRPLGRPSIATILPGRPADWQAPHERAERRPVEDVEASTAYADAIGIPLDVEPTPYVRRWTREELHCDCRTPWDHMITKEGKVAEKGIGYHCAACHNNFRNSAVAGMHQRDIMLPCRPPASIVDFETGARVLRMKLEGAHAVWG